MLVNTENYRTLMFSAIAWSRSLSCSMGITYLTQVWVVNPFISMTPVSTTRSPALRPGHQLCAAIYMVTTLPKSIFHDFSKTFP